MIYWVNRITGEITGHKQTGEDWERVDTDLEDVSEKHSLNSPKAPSYNITYWLLAIIVLCYVIYDLFL